MAILLPWLGMPPSTVWLPASSDGKTIEHNWSSPTHMGGIISQSWKFIASPAGRIAAPDETCARFVGTGLTRLGDIAVRQEQPGARAAEPHRTQAQRTQDWQNAREWYVHALNSFKAISSIWFESIEEARQASWQIGRCDRMLSAGAAHARAR